MSMTTLDWIYHSGGELVSDCEFDARVPIEYKLRLRQWFDHFQSKEAELTEGIMIDPDDRVIDVATLGAVARDFSLALTQWRGYMTDLGREDVESLTHVEADIYRAASATLDKLKAVREGISE